MMERPQRDLDDVAPRAISYRSKHLPKKWGEGAHETQEVPETNQITRPFTQVLEAINNLVRRLSGLMSCFRRLFNLSS